MRVIVAGSRGVADYDLLCRKLNHYMCRLDPAKLVIVSGGARGADAFGERWARERGVACERHPADWDRYGKQAGFLRNETMAQQAHALILFWDGRSRGSADMLARARKHGLAVRVVYFNRAV